MSDEDITWQDPPPRTGVWGKRRRFVEQLKTRPGQWALYPMTLSNYTSVSAYKRQEPYVEWTARKREDGRVDIYARYIGNGES